VIQRFPGLTYLHLPGPLRRSYYVAELLEARHRGRTTRIRPCSIMRSATLQALGEAKGKKTGCGSPRLAGDAVSRCSCSFEEIGYAPVLAGLCRMPRRRVDEKKGRGSASRAGGVVCVSLPDIAIVDRQVLAKVGLLMGLRTTGGG